MEVTQSFAGQLGKHCQPDRISKMRSFETVKHSSAVELHRPDANA